jgi:fucose permease
MAAIGTLVLLPLVLGSKAAAWLLAFAAGGFIESLYTLALIQLAQRFRNASLSSANASFISVCALGEVVGPAVTGLSMDVFGSSGMMLSAILVLATFVIFAGTKRIQVQEKRKASRLAIEAKTWSPQPRLRHS